MTARNCHDCLMAHTRVWPMFRAGCVGCADRMLMILSPDAESPSEPEPAADELRTIRDGYRLLAKHLKDAQ